jgi:hypothetical protein
MSHLRKRTCIATWTVAPPRGLKDRVLAQARGEIPALAVDTIVLGQGPDRSSLLRQRKVLGMRKAVLLLASVTAAMLMAIGGHRGQPLPWTAIPASTTTAGSSRTSPRPKSPATGATELRWHPLRRLSLPALAYFKDQLALIITGILI